MTATARLDARADLLARADLAARAATGAWVTYGAFAQAHVPDGPGRIARATDWLEATMADDAQAGRPFLAAACAARLGQGQPAPGFLSVARALGRYHGPDNGPLAAAFVALERAALQDWYCGEWPRTPDAVWATARYQAVRPALPTARFGPQSLRVQTLSDIADRYDGFILDAYGVLNIGAAAIPGAAARIADLRARGKRVVVLTNGASQTRASALAKYHAMGFDFSADEVIASRDVAANALPPGRIAAIAPNDSRFDDLPGDIRALDTDPGLLADADAFLFLGAQDWTPARHAALCAALQTAPRPLIIANPDVVAPNEDHLSLEPGHFGHHLSSKGAIVSFHGKPFAPALHAAIARLGLPPARIAMVGDTLHTDVLGGAHAGCGTVLIAEHGLYRGQDPQSFIAATGISPDVIAQTT